MSAQDSFKVLAVDSDIAALGDIRAYLAESEHKITTASSGAVLVVRQAAPHWATLIGRASAVVSEQGGFAGHLANVAREFGVPALFGCQDALTRLEAAQEVTVEAARRKVYAGIIDDLQAPTPQLTHPIAELVEDYAFRAETQEDHLTARVENEDCHFKCARLKIRGYLSLHTRQIDMIMKNEARVDALQTKMRSDIDGVLLNPTQQ